MKLSYATRMFFVVIAVLTTTTSISAMSLDDIDIETVASESGRRIPRGVASVLSKLLFGGTNTFVTLQLGEVPPDHPLVKYPNPIQMTARKTNDKLLIALPLDKDTPTPTKSSHYQRRKDRNNGAEKSDLETSASSHPGEDEDTPMDPIESAANTLSYTVLQDKYEPFIHKPPSVQKKRDPMKPASLHLPGLHYSEGLDGTVSVLPATPYTKMLGEKALKATGSQVPDMTKPPTVPIPQPVVDLMKLAASTTIEPHVTGGKTKRIPAVVQTKTLRSDGTSSVTYTPIYISGNGPFEWWRTQGLPPAPHKKPRGPPRRKIPRHHHRRPQQMFKIHPHNLQPNQIHTINSPSAAGSAAFTKQMYMTR